MPARALFYSYNHKDDKMIIKTHINGVVSEYRYERNEWENTYTNCIKKDVKEEGG